MKDEKRLLEISKKQVFETGGNTIKVGDIEFLFSRITVLKEENEQLRNELQRKAAGK